MKRYVLETPNDETIAKMLCIAFAASLLLFGFCIETPAAIGRGLRLYMTSRATLVSDYFAMATIGAAFVNASIVMFLSIGLTLLIKSPYNGPTVAALFLMPGFALFGKNPINILPFFYGVYLYSRYQKEPMRKYTAGALYSTTLAPIVSGLFRIPSLHPSASFCVAMLAGTAIGFLMIPLAQHLFQMHRGYNLFNFGFASGIVAYFFTCIAAATGLSIHIQTFWYSGIDTRVLLFILLLCVGLILLGGFFGGWRLRRYIQIMRPHGHAPQDLILSDGIGIAMLNMGVVGLICLAYLFLIGGDLSGPMLGAIFTAIGFAATGIHPRNIIPVIFGVWIASSPDITAHATMPVIQMAALFGATALAPIASEFGPLMGIVAGMMHFPLVYSSGAFTSGFNLYNNGFAAGLVAAIMVALLHTLLPRFNITTQRRIMHTLHLRFGRFRHHPHHNDNHLYGTDSKKTTRGGDQAPDLPSPADLPTDT